MISYRKDKDEIKGPWSVLAGAHSPPDIKKVVEFVSPNISPRKKQSFLRKPTI